MNASKISELGIIDNICLQTFCTITFKKVFFNVVRIPTERVLI